jgi:hypothetical protein
MVLLLFPPFALVDLMSNYTNVKSLITRLIIIDIFYEEDLDLNLLFVMPHTQLMSNLVYLMLGGKLQ